MWPGHAVAAQVARLLAQRGVHVVILNRVLDDGSVASTGSNGGAGGRGAIASGCGDASGRGHVCDAAALAVEVKGTVVNASWLQRSEPRLLSASDAQAAAVEGITQRTKWWYDSVISMHGRLDLMINFLPARRGGGSRGEANTLVDDALQAGADVARNMDAVAATRAAACTGIQGGVLVNVEFEPTAAATDSGSTDAAIATTALAAALSSAKVFHVHTKGSRADPPQQAVSQEPNSIAAGPKVSELADAIVSVATSTSRIFSGNSFRC
jgi:hypothetical protein